MSNIAWVCETYENNGVSEFNVIRKGMSRQEIIERFPPHWNSKLSFNRLNLVKAIIREAAEDPEPRDRGNIRSFWYERLMYVLLKVMGESGTPDNINSIDGTINQAWKELVESGEVTYSELNLYSEKEDLYHVCVKPDSPYPGVVIVVEKASLYPVLKDIADTYEISFVALGGRSSRAAAMEFAEQLEGFQPEEFKIFSYFDYDPDGWTMPEGFIYHLRIVLGYLCDIELVRIGITRDQIGDSVIEHGAIPYRLESKTSRGQNGKITKYENFIAQTDGLLIDGTPHQVELDIYSHSQLRDKIISALSKHLDGFPYQIRKLKQTIKSEYDNAWSELISNVHDDVGAEYDEYFEAIEEKRDKLGQEESGRAVSEREQIRELQEQIDQLQSIIIEKTADITEQKEKLRRLEYELDGQKYNETEQIISALQSDIITPDSIISEIDGDWGEDKENWQQWSTQLELETMVSSDEMAKLAQGGELLSFEPVHDDTIKIRDWIMEKMRDTADILDADGPDDTPDELIAKYLNGAGGLK